MPCMYLLHLLIIAWFLACGGGGIDFAFLCVIIAQKVKKHSHAKINCIRRTRERERKDLTRTNTPTRPHFHTSKNIFSVAIRACELCQARTWRLWNEIKMVVPAVVSCGTKEGEGEKEEERGNKKKISNESRIFKQLEHIHWHKLDWWWCTYEK